MLQRMGLRDGWKALLQSLTSKGVPTYVFSSGYGDVVKQALLLSGITSSEMPNSVPSQGGYASGFPQNLRVISNFFRTGPDGTVRGFSQPVVHERLAAVFIVFQSSIANFNYFFVLFFRNKNATTAERHMDMPLPNRPNALVKNFLLLLFSC